MDKKITIAQIKEVAQQAYDLYKTNTDGKNADYIPYLANINKNLFGISICLLNGQTIEVEIPNIVSVLNPYRKYTPLSWYCANTERKNYWRRLVPTLPDCHLTPSSLSYWKTTILLPHW